MFEGDEVWRIRRAQVALMLRVPPHVVDEMPERDIEDVLAIASAHEEIRGALLARKQSQSTRRRK